MSATANDTITAIATASGRGGVGIVRLSGPKAKTIGQRISRIDQLADRHAHFANFINSENTVLDSGIVLFFQGPHSFTGEDVVELQAHGGPVVLDLLVQSCCALGARQARPGEFSERAFLNNKMDLAQAEAIADLINSSTEQAALSATRSLRGEFSAEVHKLVEQVTQLRVYVEAAIDFPEEEIDFIADGQVSEKLQNIIDQLLQVQRSARQGSLLQEGLKLVIAGKPNAGKSSLLNQLAGEDKAIVTDIEGTTRDVLRERIQIDGMPLHIVDTAGLRDSDDAVEVEGIRRAWREIATADHILLIVDNSGDAKTDIDELRAQLSAPEISQETANTSITIVRNKCDLSGDDSGIRQDDQHPEIYLSAKSGAGMGTLREHLKQSAGFQDLGEGHFSARRRHLLALDSALHALQTGQQQLLHQGAGELLAEDLRQCQYHLGEITGAVSSDELLGHIFSSFCIGK